MSQDISAAPTLFQPTIEHGYVDAFAPRVQPHVTKRRELPPWFDRWERERPRWLMEVLAEATGVFIYVWSGVGATCSYALSTANKTTGYGDVLTIGFAYGLGIAFAIMVAGPTSGGHLSPAYTLTFALIKGFPWKKVPRYILAQILGGYLACLLCYTQYKSQFDAIDKELDAYGPLKDSVLFSANGPVGIFSFMLQPGEKIGYVFVNEFVCDIVLAIIAFTVLDSSNFFSSYLSVPFIIGCSYSILIWGFAYDTVATNIARDMGGRLAAATIWGSKAFSANRAGNYCAVTSLTGFLSTFIGAAFQLLFLSDSQRPVVNHEPEGSWTVMRLKRKGHSEDSSPSATVAEKSTQELYKKV